MRNQQASDEQVPLRVLVQDMNKTLASVNERMVNIEMLHTIVMGIPDAKQKGLVHKVDDLEEKDKKRTGMYVLISAIAGGLALALQQFVDFLSHFKPRI